MTDHPDDTYAPALNALCEIVDTAKACGFADPVDTLPQWLAGRMDALRAASLFIEQSTGEHAELTAERDRLRADYTEVAGHCEQYSNELLACRLEAERLRIDNAIFTTALAELRASNTRLSYELQTALMELRSIHKNTPLD